MLTTRLPEIERPENIEGEAPEAVLDYVEQLERRIADLGNSADLLMQMDVFPDILSRIDTTVSEARDFHATYAPEEDSSEPQM